MLAGTGGSETYTAGHVRELLRRGIKAQIVISGLKPIPSPGFRDLPFVFLKSPQDIIKLPGTLVFVNNYYPLKTRRRINMIVHNTIPNVVQKPAYHRVTAKGKNVIATSVYGAHEWALYLKTRSSNIQVVHPFAAPAFGEVKRTKPGRRPRIIFASRLYPDKGIYTLLEALHQRAVLKRGRQNWDVSIVTSGLHLEAGRTLARMLHSYPYAKLIPAQKTVKGMASVLAAHDILLMPSVYNEPFGMLSVEAQHAGCRVVVSSVGGLPGTNCGLMTIVKPRHPVALLNGIEEAVTLGAATEKERENAKKFFTLESSVDALLQVL